MGQLTELILILFFAEKQEIKAEIEVVEEEKPKPEKKPEIGELIKFFSVLFREYVTNKQLVQIRKTKDVSFCRSSVIFLM